jgi:hypothetical protein
VTAEAEASSVLLPLTHGQARARWGLPDASEGSVNDPRTLEEHGLLYNEKWIYLQAEGARLLVYWHRYDCRGVLLEASDGSTRPEPL